MNTETWIGIAASTLTTLAAVPQLIKICQEKKAENISLLWVAILISGLCAWVYYGFLKKDPVIIVSNIVAATINAIIAFFAVKYKRQQ